MTMNDLDQLVADAQADFAKARTPAELENAKARYLGKSGALTELLKGLGKLSAAERPGAGAAINVATTRASRPKSMASCGFI